jgi:hypothetical protein
MVRIKNPTIQTEIAVFWDRMAGFLPKTPEREALGDEKIFLAFAATYPEIKKYIITKTYEQIKKTQIPYVRSPEVTTKTI